MSDISSTDGVTQAAKSLLALKHGCLRKDANSTFTPYVESKHIAPMVALANNSGWINIFQSAKYELRAIGELVRSVVSDTSQRSDFRSIDMTFERMQRIHSCGYVVVQHSIALVLDEL